MLKPVRPNCVFLRQRPTPQETGFTLIELLVVIIIIGILSAIALPNFLNQTTKAKQSEAKSYVASTNRAQTAQRAENNDFGRNFDELAVGGALFGGTSVTSTNYIYTLQGGTDTASILARSRDTSLRGYSGGNSRYLNTTGENVIASVICEALIPGTSFVSTPILASGSTPIAPDCDSSTSRDLIK